VESALHEIDTHVGDAAQADDITMLAIRREQAGTR
jgi:serine phosphatase RsbU (regulator of sigma subunit)